MKHSILFTGHMVDENDREEPRFPARKEKLVRDEIFRSLVEEKEKTNQSLLGIAGGACGGDILFHEVCEELEIKTEIYLAFPLEEYKKRSVSFAGIVWEDRFDRLTRELPVHILPDEKRNTKQNVWAATNMWMLDHAQKVEEKNMILIALWDGKGGDGIGGTEHMINTAERKGANIKIINIKLI